MFRNTFARVTGVRALAAVLALLPWAPASGQGVCYTGLFSPVDASRTGQNGVATVVPDGTTRIRLDRFTDADNLVTTDDPVFDLPAEAWGAVNFAASPSLDYVLCYPCPNLPACSGVPGYASATVAVLRRPASGTLMELVHTDCLPAGVLNGTGVWYDAGACGLNTFSGACTVTTDQQPGQVPCNRILMLRTIASDGSHDELRIYDLKNTTPTTLDGQTIFAARNTLQDSTLRINRNGDFLLVQHDIAAFQPLTADWELVDVCPGSSSFGQAVHRIADDQPASAQFSASVLSCTADQTTITLLLNGVSTGSVTFPRCCVPDPPPPPTGRCCTSGGCSVTTLAACAAGVGGWTQGLTCASPCPPPPPVIRVSISAPATVSAGDVIAYSIVVSNTGSGSAVGVSVRQTLPSGATFVSASGATIASGTATWAVGTLAPGASQTFAYNARSNCVASTTQVVNTGASVSATNYPTVSPLSVTTTVQPRPVTPVTLAISGTPQRVPLRAGDSIEYRFTMQNAASAANTGLTMSFVSPGQQAAWESASADVGSATLASSGSSFSWTGSLTAGQTATIVAIARIVPCISETGTTTRLNTGTAIQVRNPCNQTVGSATPPPAYTLIRPVAATLRGVNVTSGVIGPSASGGVFGPRLYQPVREGASMEFEVELRNTLPENVPDVFWEFVIPAFITVPDPPLVAPIPQGAAWDSPARRLSYAGSIPAGSSVLIRFVGSVGSAGQCHQLLHSVAGTATCRNTSADLDLLFVPELPAQPHLEFVDGFRGLYLFTPGVDAVKRDLLCMQGETYVDLARNPASGDLFVAGLPSFLFNPRTLDFAILDGELHDAGVPAGAFMQAVAVDPVDGSLLLSSSSSPTMWRYDRASHALTTILQNNVVGAPADIIAEPDGTILILSSAGQVYRFDGRTGPFPITPTGLTSISVPAPDYSGFALGAPQSRSGTHLVDAPGGGSSLVLGSFYSTGGTLNVAYALFDIDRATHTPVMVNRALAAASYVASTGNPALPPAGLALLPAEIRNSAVVRTPSGVFVLPVGSLNTNIVGVDLSSVPPTIPVNAVNASFSAGGAVFVDPSSTPACRADFNSDGSLNPDDLGDYITCYFTIPPCPGAEFNADGSVNADDLGDFITAYFDGC